MSGESHALGRVENDTNVVERRGYKAPGGDSAEVVLVGKGG